MMNKYIAYCGLYCKDCIRHNSEIVTTAKKLINEIAKHNFGLYIDVKKRYDNGFSEYPGFITVLEKIIGLECEKPCREGNGCSAFECKILSCCKNKGYEGCWACGQFEHCSSFDFLKPFHGNAPKDNLRLIRDQGLDAFETNRHRFYTWEAR